MRGEHRAWGGEGHCLGPRPGAARGDAGHEGGWPGRQGRRRIARVRGAPVPTPPGHLRTRCAPSPFSLLFWFNFPHPVLKPRPGAGGTPAGEVGGPPPPARATHLRPRQLRCSRRAARGGRARLRGRREEPDRPGRTCRAAAEAESVRAASAPAGETASAREPASPRPSRAAGGVARAQPRALPPRPAVPAPPPAEPPGAGARGRRPEGARGPGAGRKRPRPGARPRGGAGRARAGLAPWFSGSGRAWGLGGPAGAGARATRDLRTLSALPPRSEGARVRLLRSPCRSRPGRAGTVERLPSARCAHGAPLLCEPDPV